MEEKVSKLVRSWSDILIPIALIFGFVLLLSLEVGEEAGEGVLATPLEPWLKLLVGYVTAIGEISAAAVIGVAVVRSIYSYVRQLYWGVSRTVPTIESIRVQLGRGLTLGLELTVASDILRTAVAPTRQDILILGAIVLLRTLLNHFLEEEIRRGEDQCGTVEKNASGGAPEGSQER